MDRQEIIERILQIAEDIVYGARSLQPDQFNPETYEVSADDVDKMTLALQELMEIEEHEGDYII